MTTISIANQKGGCGKTTSAIELAASLSARKKKILLIDFDQQCNLTKYVGAEDGTITIYDVLHGSSSIKEAVIQKDGFDVIISSPSLSLADREFIGNDDVFLLSDMLDIIAEQCDYDYVIIDNSPSRNVLLTMSYIASDYIITPTECDDGSIDGINAINNDVIKLRDGKRQYTKVQILGILLTKSEHTIMHSEAYKQIGALRDRIAPDAFICPIRKSIAVSECKTMQQPLQVYAPDSKPAQDYRDVADEIIKRTEEN